MKKINHYELTILTSLCLLLFPNDAFAYFDPGVTSMLFQALAAGLLVLGGFWRQIKAAVVKRFRKDEGVN